MKGSEAIARVLQAEGVEQLFCYPMNPIIDAAADLGIRPIVARTERVAVHMADGLSRMTGGRTIGVAAVQYGAGGENAFGGVAFAYSDASPILVLAGAVERARLGIPPNFSTGRCFKPIAKWAETVTDADRIPHMMQRAFALLRSGKPGPVVLEFPSDVMGDVLAESAVDDQPQRRSSPAADLREVAAAVDALLAAASPVIIAGQGVLYAEAWAELTALAELLQIPVMTSLCGKSAFPENHPLAVGTANGLSRAKTVDHFLEQADLLLAVGASLTISKFNAAIPLRKQLVQVTIDESDISKDYPTSFALIGDARTVLEQLIAEVNNRPASSSRPNDTAVAAEVQRVKHEFLEQWRPRLTANEEPTSPYRVVWELMHTLDPHRTVITHDSGCPRDQMIPFYEATVPHGYIGWGKSTPLGAGLGLIMGAKLAKPDWLAVNVMGDAAFGMVGMDFETAVRNDIPILTVLMNNGVMGGYTKKQPIASRLYDIHRLSGDYVKIAEALGGYAERVERVADLKPALQRAIARTDGGQASLLEVITADEPDLPGSSSTPNASAIRR